MTDTKDTGGKTLHVGGTKTLSIKRPADSGTVRQSFSHGRTKVVEVEKKRARIVTPGPAGKAPEGAAPKPAAKTPATNPNMTPAQAAAVKAALAQAEADEAAREEAAREAAAQAEARRLQEEEAAKSRAEAEAKAAEAAAKAAPAPTKAEPAREAPVLRAPASGTLRPQTPPAAPPATLRAGGAGAPAPRAGAEARAKRPEPLRAGEPARTTATSGRQGMVLRTLTEEEKAARNRALGNAKIAEQEARKRAEEEARRRAEDEVRQRIEKEAAEKRKIEEDARKATEDEARRRSEVDAARRAEIERRAAAMADGGRLPQADEEEFGNRRGRPGAKAAPKPAAPARPARGNERRRDGKLTVTKALDSDDERQRSVAAFRRHTQRMVQKAHGQPQQAAPVAPREVVVPEAITVSDLANRMARRAVDVIKVLMKNGIMAVINTPLDADTAQLVAEEFGHTVKRVAESDVLEGLSGTTDDAATLKPRAPVVTIMGHVDHGKTSLLDALRSTDVAAGEAGGITQHIGAYQVAMASGAKITFLDTPGHAAFTAMRSRGAKVTDIVVLVVAADDGVMPQTIEAIAHARAAKVPIIVAINKMDKPDANPDRVRNELLSHEIVTESNGGDVISVEVSATKRINLDKLEEAILLQAEVLELKANPDRAAEGAIVEAKLDKGRGPVATVLVQRGTIRVGDIVVAGSEWGRVRALVSYRGEPLQSAGPSEPVEVLGLTGTPEAGDELVAVPSEARAREIVDYRQRKRRENRAQAAARMTMEQLLKDRKEGERKLLPIVIKGDVQGSVEAIAAALQQLTTDEVGVQVLHSAVGGVTESDVVLSQASGAPIIAFNVRAHAEARERAKRDGVDIRYYAIIYNIIDDIKAAMGGLLSPVSRETFLGNAEILEVFSISKVGKVAGCKVVDGVVRRGAKVRLIRDKIVIHEGKLSTLKRFKDEVKEVQKGFECGMAFEAYQDIQPGDIIECFDVETVQRTL